MRLKKAFTYVELLIALTLIGIIFLPTMQLFSHSLYSVNLSRDLITATNLATWHMEKMKNLTITKIQFLEMGDQVYPPAKAKPFELNGTSWRIYTDVREDSNPLEIDIKVYREGEQEKPLITLVTLIEDALWEVVKPGTF
ncbi:MAG: hypothetical protein JXD21_06860 [Candidatus Omnitrophica bacterium]|nr:hypothetical protein [Candidatus Omnitrophota bacterium]